MSLAIRFVFFLGFSVPTLLAQVPRINNGGVVNTASYREAGLLAPGVRFSVFGSALTDGTTASSNSPQVPTQLAGARILINGASAPLFFASPLQLDAQFPVELAGATTASLQVQVQLASGTVTSVPVSISVVPFSPGIFTLDQSGSGPGAILRNGDFSKICPRERSDCSGNPAVRGEPIAIYVTGLGQVDGPWVTGQVAAQPSPTLETPTVMIGGIESTVLLSALATGFVGLYQVNVVVPADAPIGDAIPLNMSVAGSKSNDVTIYIAAGIAGPPANISKVSGDNQTGTVGKPLTNPFVVRITDASGIPVPGVIVTFAATSGGNLSASASTDSFGLASSLLTLGTVAGNNTVTVSSPGLSGIPLTFNVTSSPGPPASILFQSGGSTGTVGRQLSNPLVVQIIDSFRNPVADASVTFGVTSGGGMLSASAAITNTQGLASTLLTLGAAAGVNTVAASVTSLSPVTFIAFAKPGPPVAISAASGNGQTGAVGHALSLPFVVKVVDSFANTVSGVPVTFAVASGAGTLAATSSATDSQGLAATVLTLGTAVGVISITANSAGLSGSPITFTANGVLSSDLVITMRDSPDPVQSAGRLIYSIALANVGSADAANVTMTDMLPARVSFVSCAATVGTCSQSAGTVTAHVGTLPMAGAATITVTVTAPTVTSQTFITNRASVSTASREINTANNQIGATTTVNSTSPAVGRPGGPSGGSIDQIVIDPQSPDTIYAVNNHGVFKSTNGGATWLAVNNGMTPRSLWVLAADPNNSGTVYTGGCGDGLFKSIDAGLEWSAVNRGLASRCVGGVVVDPSNSATVYVLVEDGVYKSSDGAVTWNRANMGLSTEILNVLAIDPSNPARLYAAGSSKSTNGGATWSTTRFHFAALAIDPTNSLTVYAADRGNGVLKSLDGGDTARPSNNGLSKQDVISIAIDPSNPNAVYAGSRTGGLFKTTNGGITWVPINTGLSQMTVGSIAIDPSNSATLYVGTSGGIFKSVDGGGTWNADDVGLGALNITELAVDRTDPTKIYAITPSQGAVFESANAGGSWITINHGLENISVNTVAVDPFSSSTLYVGAIGDTGVFKSTDGGASWSAASTGIKTGFTNNNTYALATDPLHPGTLYAGGGGGAFKSTNGGGSWLAINTGSANFGAVNYFAVDSVNSTVVYATSSGGIIKTVNAGDNWAAINNGLTNRNVISVGIDPIRTGTLYAGTNGDGVFKSTDGGTSWSAVNTGLANLYLKALAVDPIHSGTLYAATDGGGVFKSSDGGASWNVVNTGLPAAVTVNCLAVDQTNSLTVYAGTAGYGVFKSTNGGQSWQPTGAN